MPDIEQKLITDWLDELGYSWELLEEPTARFNIAFEYPKEGKGYMHVVCVSPQSVRFVKGISVAEEHKQGLTELGFDGFAAFYFGLLRDLLRSGLTYRVTGEPAEARMDGVQIQQEIFVEELTRTSFLHLAQRMNSTALLVAIHVRRALGQMP